MIYFSLLHVGHGGPLAVLILEVAVHAGDHLGVVLEAVHTIGAAGQLVDRVTDILHTANLKVSLEDDLQ